MAMRVRYTVLDGEVISETRGGVERDYVPDPLGSTVALLDSTQTQTDTFAYWPYGEVRSRTGSTATPFQFVGTAGYYRDSASRTYVRARYLDTAKGRWMTKDLRHRVFIRPRHLAKVKGQWMARELVFKTGSAVSHVNSRNIPAALAYLGEKSPLGNNPTPTYLQDWRSGRLQLSDSTKECLGTISVIGGIGSVIGLLGGDAAIIGTGGTIIALPPLVVGAHDYIGVPMTHFIFDDFRNLYPDEGWIPLWPRYSPDNPKPSYVKWRDWRYTKWYIMELIELYDEQSGIWPF